MKIKLLKILVLWSSFALFFVNAEDLKNSNEDTISLRIEKLNKQINIDEIDTFNLRMEHQEIYELLKNIEIEKKVSIYLSLIKNIRDIKLKSISHLMRRMSLEESFIKEIKRVIESNIFTNELQTNLVLGIEKNLLLTKKPLYQVVKNDGKYLIFNAKENLKEENLTSKQIDASTYMYDYAQEILNKYLEIELKAIKTGSFIILNNLIEKEQKKFLVEYTPQKNIDQRVAFKQYLEYTASQLAYVGMSRNLDTLYKSYMQQIKNNEVFLENYN